MKRIETRSWKTSYRGPILVHASKQFPLLSKNFAEAERRAQRLVGDMPFGAIVARATLTDCRPTEDLVKEITHIEEHLGNYAPGRWGWLLSDIEALPTPIPWKGCLYLWEVPEELAAKVEEQFVKGGV